MAPTCIHFSHTFTFMSFSTALLLVRLISMERLFLGTAIHMMPSRMPPPGGCCSAFCCSSSRYSSCCWSLGPFKASAGARKTTKQHICQKVRRATCHHGIQPQPDLMPFNAKYSPKCVSNTADRRSVPSRRSNERLRLCNKTAKFIIVCVFVCLYDSLRREHGCHAAHGHRDFLTSSMCANKHVARRLL